jgi:hypothetical protein
MSEQLDRLRDIINKIFDVLEVLLVRILLLVLAGIGAYGLIVGHH